MIRILLLISLCLSSLIARQATLSEQVLSAYRHATPLKVDVSKNKTVSSLAALKRSTQDPELKAAVAYCLALLDPKHVSSFTSEMVRIAEQNSFGSEVSEALPEALYAIFQRTRSEAVLNTILRKEYDGGPAETL